VRSADNGQTAIQAWEEWRPRLILMDVHMPVMDGIQATRKIKSEPGGKETLIVVLTASAMDHDRRVASESGADDFLAKPCREDELLEKMRMLLGIAFDYEELSSDEDHSPAGVATLSADSLAQLPQELIQEILTATTRGNKRLLDELIRKVPEPQSAAALQGLADKYDYDALTQLLEEAWRR
jgi:CheY-like chemotaxis protein